MNSKEFITQLKQTGKVSDEEIFKFLIKNYFLKGYTLDDFEDDIVLKYNCSYVYAKELRFCFEEKLKKYSR